MFGKSKEDQDVGSGVQRSTATQGEATSTISSGLSIVGKIVGHGAVTIFGHVEGELQASTVVIAEGAEVEGDIVAEELTVSGRVEGTVRANRVKLNSTAVVDGDILHRSLVMEENAQFDGASRRLEDVINTSSRACRPISEGGQHHKSVHPIFGRTFLLNFEGSRFREPLFFCAL